MLMRKSVSTAIARQKARQTRLYSHSKDHHHGDHHKAGAHEPDVVFEHHGTAGVARLNRPKALNSLNLNMVRLLAQQYKAWEAAPSHGSHAVSHVILVGTGEKAFCAGGDIRAIYDAGKETRHATTHSQVTDIANEPITSAFFREEYQLNHMIGTFKKPHISIIDGITMGGGVGVSIHGSVRVATENTTFAMPETGIGFFPDVGGSHALPRLHNFGTFFGLTGYRIQGFDVKEAGVATHYVLKEFIPELTHALAKATTPKDIHNSLTHFEDLTKKKAPGKSSFLQQNSDMITRCFANQHSVADILKALAKEASPLAHELADTLTKKVSPLAVRVTFEQLQRGRKLSLAECLEMEFRMTQHAMKAHDFFEGVRALLVDKDKKPKWTHASIESVKDSEVAKFFDHVPNELKLPRQR